MFYKHFINENNDELYLFIDNNFEFSKELTNKNFIEKNESILDNVKKYLKEKNIKFNGKKILLVSSGIVVGTLFLSNPLPKTTSTNIEPKVQYAVSLENINDVKIPEKNNIENKIVVENNANTAPIPSTQVNIPKTNTPTKNTTINNTNNTVQSTPKIEETITAEKTFETPVTVYRANGSIEVMELEDFIVGVVAAEMPASFNSEALKAQAVATRTYYLKALDMNKKITEINSGQQTYKDINQLKAYWKTDFNTYYNKVRNAVESTKGEYITYDGKYIEAVYSSTNNGYSESSLDVWGNYYPYLISVESPWDINTSSYLKTIKIDLNVLESVTGLSLDDLSEIKVLSRTDGNSIKEIQIEDRTYSGLFLRNSLGLRSTDFDIDINGGTVSITTRGYGHGVGMSQYGANGMANAGYNYRQIINHYYPNTKIEKM